MVHPPARGWIPTSDRLPGAHTVPYHRTDGKACGHLGECYGQYFDWPDVQGEFEGEGGAWYCEICQEWTPASVVDAWFELPATEDREEA